MFKLSPSIITTLITALFPNIIISKFLTSTMKFLYARLIQKDMKIMAAILLYGRQQLLRLMSQKSTIPRRSSLLPLLVAVLCIYPGQSFCYDTTLTQFSTANSLDFSFDNNTFVAVDTPAKQVNFWRMDTKQLTYVYSTTTNSPTCAKFSRNGNIIGIGMSNGDVLLLNANTYTPITTITPTTSSVLEIDFSWVSSTSVIACSSTQIVYTNWASSATWTLSPGAGVYSCKLNKEDGIGYSQGKELRWFGFNTTSNPIARDSAGGSDLYRQVDFSPETGNNMRLITASNINNGEFYELRDGQNSVSNFYTSVNAQSYACCYSKDGNYMVGGDRNGKVYIVNTNGWNDKIIQSLAEVKGAVTHCHISYDSKYLGFNENSTGNIIIYTTNCINPICQQGFYLNNRVCTSCSSIFACLACNGPSTCTACVQGFYINGNSCDSCTTIPNCRSCLSSNKCTECKQGYTMDYSTNACTLCDTAIKGCISCQRNSTNTTVFCHACHIQFYLNSTDLACYACSSNNPYCMRCNSSAFCLQCSLAFYADANGTCQPCTGNCLQCNSSSSCMACAKGYYSLGGTCTACSANCFDCNNTGSCVTCARGFFLSGENCQSCTPPCLACATSANNCVTCALGFYLSSTGVCSRCINNCASCTAVAVCLSCQVGYFITANNTCLLCSGITPNCVSCSSMQCFSCQSSYILNSAFACVNCLSYIMGCLSCNSSTICEQCHVGFYLTSPSCTPCASQCISCTSGAVCLSCAVGYYLSGTSCLQCSPNCLTCTGSNICLSCITGYFLNTSATPKVCSKCQLSLVGCVSCSSSTVCIDCELGKYLSGSTCAYCFPGCSTCYNSTVCFSCSVGYYLTNTTCTKCPQNCSECSSSTLCSSCNTGFYLDSALSSNNCISCVGKGCESCNSTVCLSCQIGYYLSSSACVICNTTLPNCYACSETLCYQCTYGYYSNAGVCASCLGVLNGCASCTNSSVCTECTAGYYLLANNSCAVCPIQCKTCKNNICTNCQMQYIFNAASTDCLLCESFLDACLSCSSNSSCLKCYEGFYLTAGNQCASCRSALTGCISCANSSTCLVCQDEYYLLGGVCTNCRSIQACTYCRNSSVCLSCISGYYLNSGNTCSLCTSSLVGCLFCSSALGCLDCQSGYFLNITSKQCQLCVNSLQGCLSCASSVVCLNCDGGYYLDTTLFTCKSCNVTGCQICGDTSPNTCISCSLGYYLNGGGNACLACSQNACLQCSGSAACLRCDSGYFLSGSTCSSCKTSITACSKCSNATICNQCDSTYFLNSSNQCEQCSASLDFCQICLTSTYCTVCSSGYFSSLGTCTSCSTITGCFMCTDASTCQNCVNGYYFSGSNCITCSSPLSNCYQCDNSTTCLSCLSGYVLDSSGNCNQVTGGSAPAPLPIPQLQVKTYYVNATQLKHVMLTKQSYSFTKQSLSWNSVTTISLYNSVSRMSVSLTISSVEWGSGSTSIIFFTNNPLNLSADAISMPLARLLLTQEDISFSYQTKFQITKAALQLLMPDQVIPNDFTQQKPLMEPSFYLSYLQNSGEYYLSIIGFVIVATLFFNFFLRATCTVSHSRNIGEIVPHILSLKTAVLMVFPIYPQIGSFCYGMMAADLPWFNQYFSSLSYLGDIQPAGFQLFFVNMNFAAFYVTPFILFLLLLLLGYITFSPPNGRKDEVFSLQENYDDANRGSHAFLRMVFMYFSFGITFAGAVSIQGALYNPADYLSVNGAFYMFGGLVYCVQMAVSIHLTRKESRGCYMRSFAKATIISVAHISPVYICTLAVALDIALLSLEYLKYKEAIKYPKVWLAKHLLANFALLLLYFVNTKRIALMTVITLTFLSVLIQLIEHVNEGTAEEPSKRVKPVIGSDKDRNESRDQKNDTKEYFIGDLKLGKESLMIEPPFGDSLTTFKNSKGFTSDLIFDEEENDRNAMPSSQKTKYEPLGEKRHRPFRAIPRKKDIKIQPIMENADSSRQ